jgi:hypothetical protein
MSVGYMNSSANSINMFQLTLDGTDICVVGSIVTQANQPGCAAMNVRIACTGNASHTLVLNWKVSAGTMTINPTASHTGTSTSLMHCNVLITEVPS